MAAALALFGVVRRTLLSETLRPRFEGAATGLAFGIALVWVVHPLHTASVTYVVRRVESLMGMFYLLTLTVRFDRRKGRAPQSGRPRPSRAARSGWQLRK